VSFTDQAEVASRPRDLFGAAIAPAAKRKVKRANGYAAPVGSGPEGDTCGSCKHAWRKDTGTRKTFWKCALVRPTNGRGTDILKKSAACLRWEAKGDTKL
jgi:hypothetical protein